MSNAKHVLVVSVQKHDDGCVVGVSGKGGLTEYWILGEAQMRMLAISFAAVFRDVPPQDLAREIAGMCAVEQPVA